jgi:putative ABC transport system substrate-binding protein
MIERRILLTVTLALLFLAAPLAAEAQTGKAYRVGVMFFNTRQVVIPFIEALEKGFRDRGYVAGRNFTIDYKFAEGQAERLPALAAELAHLNVDVFVMPFNTTAELVRQVAPKSPIVRRSPLIPLARDS